MSSEKEMSARNALALIRRFNDVSTAGLLV